MRPMRHAGRRAAALERIFLTADAAILLLDDDRITECNPAALHLFGVHRRTRLLARELAALSPPVQPDGTGSAVGMRRHLEHAAIAGEARFAWSFSRGDGGATFLADMRILAYEHEGATAFAAIVRDVNLQTRELQAANANLQLILDTLPGRVTWIGPDRRHLYFNHQYEAFLGKPASEILGRTVAEILGEESFRRVQHLGDAAMQGETVRWEGWLHYPERGDRYIQCTCAPRLRPDGAIDGYFNFMVDLTDQKRAEEEVRHRERILSIVHAAASRILSTGNWRASIEQMLAEIGVVMGVSRAMLNRNGITADGQYHQEELYEWDAAGVVRVMGNRSLRRPPVRDPVFRDWHERRSRGEVLQVIVSELPDDMRRWLESQGVRSALRVPVFAAGTWWGTLGFDQCDRERRWESVEVELLGAAAALIGLAIEHDRTLAALQASKAEAARKATFLEAVLGSIAQGINVFDADLNLQLANDRFLEMYGFPPALGQPGTPLTEFIRHRWSVGELLPGEERTDEEQFVAARLAAWRELMTTRQELRTEEVRPDGRVIDVRRRPLSGGGFVTTYTDLSEERRMHEALRESEQRLRNIVEANPLPLVISRRDDRRIVYANHRAAEMLGLPIEAIIGCDAESFYADAGTRQRIIDHFGSDGLAEAMEVCFRRGDGTTVWVELTARPIRFEGQPAIVSGFHDLTERKRAEAADTLFRTVIDAIPATIHVKDREFRYRMVNRYYLDTWKLRFEDVVGRTQDEVFHDGLAAQADARDRKVLATKQPSGFYEVSYPDGTGATITLWANKIPLLDEAGEVAHIVTVGMDISKLKEAEAEIARQREALHQTEKLTALGALLAGVAHELNNPLSVVVTQAVLMKETTTDPRTAERAAKIQAAAERCARIVKSFLAIARQRPPVRAAVRLEAVVQAAVDLTAYGLRSNGIELHLDVPPGLPEIWGDADQLGQVLMNLIVNAQQVLQEVQGPRHLSIAAGVEAGGVVRLTVADNGPGVPPPIRSRIFDPFFTTKPVGFGTGMGLSLCMGIISAHSGTIWLEDTPGGGATFVVRLPGAKAESAQPGVAATPSWQGLGDRILIVEDEPEIAQALAEIVAPLVREVDIAENGAAALRRLGDRTYDLIISDLRMPDLDGPGLFRALEQRRSSLAGRILFVTGDTLSPGPTQFLRESRAPFLEKPFDPADVRRQVSEMLKRAAADRQPAVVTES